MTIGEPIRATRVGLEFKKHLLGIAKNPIKLFVGIKLTDSWPIFSSFSSFGTIVNYSLQNIHRNV